MSFFSKAKNKLKHHVSKAGGGSKLLAQAAPWAAAFTTAGRRELKGTYGAIGGAVVNSLTGGQGGAFYQTAIDAISPDAPIRPSSSEPNSGAAGFSMPAQRESSPLPSWAIPAAIAGAIGLVVLVVAIRRR